MKPIHQIRRERLAELVQKAGSQVAVADAIGKNKNQVGQWLRQPGTPGARNMGNASARKLETAFAKPEGWLDTPAEGFIGNPEQSPDLHPESYPSRLPPATIKTVHEMLRWRFDYEGQQYNIEAMPELFSLAFQAALSGTDSDKAALKAAVDQALNRGRVEDEERSEEPAGGSRSHAVKRGGTGAAA
jgi:hypothetical protein